MGPSFFFSRLVLLLAGVLGLLVAVGRAEVVPLLQPGFFFDYNIPGQPVPIPITEQCETIHITWGRENAIGPNPVAPYSMVVFTSTFTTPFTIATGSGLSFDWQVPFAPGTQYQICMWDKNGVPGGCQAMYTVIQNSTVAEPTCQNVTIPTQLKVNATQAVPAGPLSQYGFIDQCTDIIVQPMSGKPPYTLTVSPPLHPQFNITSNSLKTIDWTVSLPWSYPFFLSLQSADGQLWSFGPLHAGGFGPTNCLVPGMTPQSTARNTAVGAGLGGALAAGILVGIGTFLYLRTRPRPSPQVDAFDTQTNGPISAWRNRLRSDSQPATEALSWTTVSDRRTSQTLNGPGRNRTYVLHHDAGSAPVTVITDATEVVELPPRYNLENNAGGASLTTGLPRLPLREKPQPEIPESEQESSGSTSSL